MPTKKTVKKEDQNTETKSAEEMLKKGRETGDEAMIKKAEEMLAKEK